MDLLESKETILNEVNKLFENYSTNVSTMCQQITHISQELSMVHQMNHKLMKEIEEKDKLLLLNEKKCYDYEVMINKIQEDANKEVDEKTRHDMLRAQDKEIFNRDEEIKRLQKKVDEQGETIKQKNQLKNRVRKEPVKETPEEVEVNIKAIEKVGVPKMNKKELQSKSGGKLVEKMKEITQKQTIQDEIENPVVTEVVEDVVEVKEEVVNPVVTEVVEDVIEVKEVVEDVENPVVTEVVEEDNSGETTEELSEEDEEITVSTISYYGKDYYIIEDEEPQYLYAIEDGELGDKKGEIKNGKKHMYKK